MTITYTAEVATSTFSCFLKLLARWRGSIYKLLWKDFTVFAVIYFVLSFLYRFVLNADQRRIFELISRYCLSNNTLIPVAFILGFYVMLIMTRYWNCLSHIPWPDHMALFVTANVQGLDERSRKIRRSMLRYLCLSYTMTMAAISPTVKKRFPTLQHMVDAGLMTSNEKTSLEEIKTPHNKFFIPLAWTTRLVVMARKERRIEDEFAVKTLIDEINQFRMHLATLFVYDWITIPLVYTQVVTLAVYMFFLACLMGRQFLHDDPDAPDLYFPLFTFLEYFFYMGWLKVAECLVNPFGEDEEDFDVNFLIDRNLQVSYIIVDEVYNEPPDLVRDQHWDETHFEMPYTAEAEPFRKAPHLGSAVDIRSAKDLDLAFSMREEMDPIQEASSSEENDDDTDFRKGSRPSHGILQSPGGVLKRLFSRQDSRSHVRGVPIPLTKKDSTGASSVATSPASHQHADDLQFNMEFDNPELNADDNLLIQHKDRKTSTEAIAMRKMKQTQTSPRHSKDMSGTSSSPPRSSVHMESKDTSGSVSSPPRSSVHFEHKPDVTTELLLHPEPKRDRKEVVSMPAGLPTSPDGGKDITDFTTTQQEIPTSSAEPVLPTSAEPTTPSSPDVWVLAASRFNLTTPTTESTPTTNEQKT